jgi:putative membrane protein
VASRETLSPLMLRGQVPALLHVALDGVHLPEHGWQAAAPPSRRRAVVRNLMLWTLPLIASWIVGTPAFVLILLCAVLSTLASLGRVARFEWVAFDGGLALRSGWLWRRTTVVRHNRIQLASLWQSPFDRRHDMATVEVDSAGSSAPTINLPWLMRDDAVQLVARLDAGIAATEFSV